MIDTDADAFGWREVEPPPKLHTEARAEIALTLGQPEHAPVLEYPRLLTDRAGRRLSHKTVIPFAVLVEIPALEAALDSEGFPTGGQLYAILAAAGHTLAYTDDIRARMPTPDDSTALRIPGGTPMFTTHRAISDATTGRVLAYEETRRSADDTQLRYHLTTADTTAANR
ncbi:UTRA domain-containing protein [Fodinicola feengrottensis]|uniref:UTRA domain-containing protein n=1 Tax=Fodinicola feengrottensis TaxID=435914 RepID=UPI0013D669AA|nr:UTRA domain-containing protein [Fodinicola feengrottensis]